MAGADATTSIILLLISICQTQLSLFEKLDKVGQGWAFQTVSIIANICQPIKSQRQA